MSTSTRPSISLETLAEWVHDARQRTLDLVADLSDEQMFGPRLAIVNPLIWEIGHLAWFQEKWVLRHAAGHAPLRGEVDSLYDSMAVAHDTRWSLPLPSRQETLDYLMEVRDKVLERVTRRPGPEETYFILLTVFHEDMHDEAFTYTRQTLGYPAPRFSEDHASANAGRPDEAPEREAGPWPGDALVPGGAFRLGAEQGEPFVFDNEKWAHRVDMAPFAIARAPVTQAEFASFVDEGGYLRRQLWSGEGWSWRTDSGAEAPVYWRRAEGQWHRRQFDRWVPLEAHRPVIHVNWHEAEAFCRWAGRRLPTEAEWEAAASSERDGGRLSQLKRRFPWGGNPPDPRSANLDWRAMGCVDVGAHAAGESPTGCRQMIGNVWEWTASDFVPYPGFLPDPYKEYSEPWFGDQKVLRGGCWATRSRLLRNTWRNFYTPDRRDVWAGFRTAAVT